MNTTTVELTASELATLIDAAHEHERLTIESQLRRDHPIFADMQSTRTKLAEAYDRVAPPLVDG